MPSSPYSSPKLRLAVLSYHRKNEFLTITARVETPRKLIPKILFALKKKPLPLYGDGSNVRDWLYVHDHCRAIDMILQHGRVGEIYNVGAGEERLKIDLICRI